MYYVSINCKHNRFCGVYNISNLQITTAIGMYNTYKETVFKRMQYKCITQIMQMFRS